MNLKKNKAKYIQNGAAFLCVGVLILNIILLSYAKYTSNKDFNAYNANVGDFYEGQYKIAAYLNGEKQDEIPSRTFEENGETKTAYVRNIQCTDGATGRWDTELWNLTVSGSTKTGTKCEIYFDTNSELADNTTYATKYNPFPIGYVFLTTGDSPESTFGGTWEEISANQYLRTGTVGTDIGQSGGQDKSTVKVKEHALLINEIPKHTHTRGSMNITGGGINAVISLATYWSTGSGALTRTGGWSWGGVNGGSGFVGGDIFFDASKNWTGESSNAQTPGDSSKQANGDAHNHGFKTSTNNGSSWTDSDSIEINNPKYYSLRAFRRTA